LFSFLSRKLASRADLKRFSAHLYGWSGRYDASRPDKQHCQSTEQSNIDLLSLLLLEKKAPNRVLSGGPTAYGALLRPGNVLHTDKFHNCGASADHRPDNDRVASVTAADNLSPVARCLIGGNLDVPLSRLFITPTL